MKRKRDTGNTDRPNQAANKSQAEGERWRSEPDTIERRERDRGAQRGTGAEEGGGISNRPIGEEIHSQERVPERGDSRSGEQVEDAALPSDEPTLNPKI